MWPTPPSGSGSAYAPCSYRSPPGDVSAGPIHATGRKDVQECVRDAQLASHREKEQDDLLEEQTIR
jgi:hypothetical protein